MRPSLIRVPTPVSPGPCDTKKPELPELKARLVALEHEEQDLRRHLRSLRAEHAGLKCLLRVVNILIEEREAQLSESEAES